MKDLVIRGNWLKKELIIFASTFIFAFIVNIIGIIKHNTQWIELVSQLHVVFILAVVLYILLWLVRLIIYVVILPFRKKNK